MSTAHTQFFHESTDSDDSAFVALVLRHIDWVYAGACRRSGDAHLAEDAVQATFMLLYRKAPHFSAERTLVTWLDRTIRIRPWSLSDRETVAAGLNTRPT